MKSIIFQINYQGMISPEKVSDAFSEKFKQYFNDLEITFAGSLDSEIYNFDEISDVLSIPVREIQNQDVYRYSENKFGSDYAILDISKYFSVLTIECRQYEGIDLYLEFFSYFIEFLYNEVAFFKIKTLRLRKLGGKIFFDNNEIFDVFEKEYFNFGNTEYNSLKCVYKDILEGEETGSPIINYIRYFDSGEYYDAQTNEDKKAFQVLLDIDSYYTEEKLDSLEFNEKDVRSLLEHTNNEHLFKIFKMSVTEKFLKLNSHE